MIENHLLFKKKELINITCRELGVSYENEQETLIFQFNDQFIDGEACLEVEYPSGKKGFIELEKDNESYKIVVKSGLLTEKGYLKMQLRIENQTDVWKSYQFEMVVIEAVNAVDKIEESYPNFATSTIAKLKKLEDDNAENQDNISQLNEKIGTIEQSITTDYNDLENKPTALSEFENDCNFIADENYVHTDNNFTDADKTRLDGFENYDDTVLIENIAALKEENEILKNQIPNRTSLWK